MNEQLHLTKLGSTLKQLLEKKSELEETTKSINAEIDQLQGQFVEAMQLHNLQNFKINNLGQFYLHSSVFSKITDKEKLFEDLRKRGAEDIIKETVFPSTLRAYTKELMEHANEIPAGVEVHTRTTVRIRKT